MQRETIILAFVMKRKKQKKTHVLPPLDFPQLLRFVDFLMDNTLRLLLLLLPDMLSVAAWVAPTDVLLL